MVLSTINNYNRHEVWQNLCSISEKKKNTLFGFLFHFFKISFPFTIFFFVFQIVSFVEIFVFVSSFFSFLVCFLFRDLFLSVAFSYSSRLFLIFQFWTHFRFRIWFGFVELCFCILQLNKKLICSDMHYVHAFLMRVYRCCVNANYICRRDFKCLSF